MSLPTKIKRKISVSFDDTMKFRLDLVCGAGLPSDYAGSAGSAEVVRVIRNLRLDDDGSFILGTIRLQKMIFQVSNLAERVDDESDEWTIDCQIKFMTK